MIGSMADDSPPPSLTSESQPDGFRTASARPECRPLYPSPSSSESILASKAFLPPPNPSTPHPSWVTSSTPCPGTSVPSPLGTLPHRLLGLHTVTGPGCMQQWQGTCSSSWQRPCSPPHWAGTGMVATPAPKRRANKRKQTKNGGEPSGLGEEGRGSPGQGNGVHLVNASGLETGNGGEARGSDEGWRDSQEEGERAVMQLGTNLLLLYQILSQSIGVC